MNLGQYLHNTHHEEGEEDAENRTPTNNAVSRARKQQQQQQQQHSMPLSSSKRGGLKASSPSGMASFISDASPSPTRRLLFAVDRSDPQRAPFQALEDLAMGTANHGFVSPASSGANSATKTPHEKQHQQQRQLSSLGVSPIFRSASPKQRGGEDSGRHGEHTENEKSPVFFLSSDSEEEEATGDSPGAFYPEEEAGGIPLHNNLPTGVPSSPSSPALTPDTTDSVRGSSIAPQEEEEPMALPLASSSSPPPPMPGVPATPVGPPPSVDRLLARAQAIHTPEVVRKGWIAERLSSAIRKFVFQGTEAYPSRSGLGQTVEEEEDPERSMLDTSSLCVVGEGGESIRGDCEEEDNKDGSPTSRVMDVSALASPQFLQYQYQQSNTPTPHKTQQQHITTDSIEKCPQFKQEALLRGGFPAARPHPPSSSPLLVEKKKSIAVTAASSSSLTAAAPPPTIPAAVLSSSSSLWSASSSSSSPSSPSSSGPGTGAGFHASSSFSHENSRTWGAASACSRHRPELRGGGGAQEEEEEGAEAIRRQMLALSMTRDILAAREEKKENGKKGKKEEPVPTSILDVLSMASSCASSLSFSAASASRDRLAGTASFSFSMPESSDEEGGEDDEKSIARPPPVAKLPHLYSPLVHPKTSSSSSSSNRPLQRQQKQAQRQEGRAKKKTFAALLYESDTMLGAAPASSSSSLSLSSSSSTPLTASAAAPITWAKLLVGCAASRELLLRNCHPGPCTVQTYIAYPKEEEKGSSSRKKNNTNCFEVRCRTGAEGEDMIDADGILRFVVTFRPVLPGMHRATLHLRISQGREGKEGEGARVYEVELAGTASAGEAAVAKNTTSGTTTTTTSSRHTKREQQQQQHVEKKRESSGSSSSSSSLALSHPPPLSATVVGFAQGLLNFGRHPQGSVVVQKVKLCNPSPVAQLVVLESVALPFVLTHRVIKLKPRAFVQLPIRFVPVHGSGAFATTLRASVHKLTEEDGLQEKEENLRKSLGQSIALELRGFGGPRED